MLVPGGVAYVKSGGTWEKTVKPRSPEIDEWTHFLHDAGNNAVARDTRVGPPRSLQWMAPPLWLRSHETPSGVQAMVCGSGRVFYILDEGLIGVTDQRLPERLGDPLPRRFQRQAPLAAAAPVVGLAPVGNRPIPGQRLDHDRRRPGHRPQRKRAAVGG